MNVPSESMAAMAASGLTKSRGRPRKEAQDEATKSKRERNRRAQQLFRLRQKATETEQKQSMKTLEDTISHVVNVFLDVADQTMQSPYARQDKALMEKLSQSMHSILSVISDSGDLDVQQQELPELEEGPVQSVSQSAMDLWTEPATSHEQHVTEILPSQADYGLVQTQSSVASPSNYVNEMAQDPRLRINIFGNGLMFRLAPDNLFASINEVKPRLDDSLGVFITHMAIYRGYQALLRDKDVTSPRLRLAFGVSLSVFSRDELLRTLRYILGPGSARMGRLASINLNRCFDYMAQNSAVPDDVREYFAEMSTAGTFVNSDELAQLIREKTLGEADEETLDMMVDVKSLGQAGREGPDWAAQGDGMAPEDDFPVRLVRVSKYTLVDSIARSGTCLGQGPLFRKSDLDSLILASEISTTG
ncbi:hypothetical protein B0I35DRAFT_482542 [Stachybotrys elegans]|uniref:BZIP domain-containing protein n=1 Tax=Stachybotrys elegans TaxID=80388 RepID=A0A8K0SEJ5_9HYPO|nr:hypothetical protein B0I35DRAFT_482542 [Stachybotrys elegans]